MVMDKSAVAFDCSYEVVSSEDLVDSALANHPECLSDHRARRLATASAVLTLLGLVVAGAVASFHHIRSRSKGVAHVKGDEAAQLEEVSEHARDGAHPTYPYGTWSTPIKTGKCSASSKPLRLAISPKTGTADRAITCALEGGIKAYRFPAGIFEISEQLLVPESVSITGAKNPNDMSDPTRTPDWKEQTLFLATRGVTDYLANYCHAKDMVVTRVGFVLSSSVTVRNVSYQGLDTIRPNDNGALCGGGAFETKGCAENDCKASGVNNGGSDGIGSTHVTIENVRLNDYYYAEDEAKVGGDIKGNYDCKTEDWTKQCCFCKPNGVRSSQIGIWVPQSRNPEGTHDVIVKNVVSSSTQADGINLHGYVADTLVQNVYFQASGDDMFALWGAASNPANVTFKDCIAVNPGILRANWYGTCVATYGLKSVLFQNITCRAPTLKHPIPSPSDGAAKIDMSMFVFYNSFWASYPPGNSITIKGFTFEDLHGHAYTPSMGSMDKPAPRKMVWTKSSTGVAKPYYVPTNEQPLNVH
eukprot:CAMPEP_0179146836 /NCGR_PEP_ID=MMETSP0796-20121207/70941_1 /TAXON_ID=73915 /ORGANISM="Pyrodinium bahamense, Strain pbaha01" /LENGTH=528 /DNA_ID=CAMNT_0020847371 /DNA_START=21 /DNA_END=1607 /DNA_ORIENTATION=-